MELLRIRGSAVAFEKWSVQTATALRVVGALWEMGTMWTWEVEVRWVSLGGSGVGETLVE